MLSHFLNLKTITDDSRLRHCLGFETPFLYRAAVTGLSMILYPRKVGLFVINNFFPPLSEVKLKSKNGIQKPASDAHFIVNIQIISFIFLWILFSNKIKIFKFKKTEFKSQQKWVLMVKWLECPTFISMFQGSNPGLVIGNFLQYFIISATLAPSGPLSGESTFHYHQSWWLTCLIQLCHEMPVCECECVNECDFRLKVVCCWGLFWSGMVGGRKRASTPFSQSYLSFLWNFREC
jgi:hypothetical protein